MRLKKLCKLFSLFIILYSALSFAEPSKLTLRVYNPGNASLFPVSSTLILGNKEAILVDAQFQKNDAEKLVTLIKKSGKKLSIIYISHSDPDYYFGLETLAKNFPEAKILSTPQTAYLINASKDQKLALWASKLKERPSKLITPEVIKENYLDLEGNKIYIQGLKQDPDHTYLWIPSIKTILGGVLVSNGIHVWLADSQSEQSRQNWIKKLEEMRSLSPKNVIPGHFLMKNQPPDFSSSSLQFTQDYIQHFDQFLHQSPHSQTIIAAMKKLYPGLAEEGNLQLSAKVLSGEMPWKTLSSFPAIGKKMRVKFGNNLFELNFKDNKNMSFEGLSGQFKGDRDNVQYTAIEIRPQVYMVYWHEPTSMTNVVHIEDFEHKTVYTNIAAKDGSFTHLKGTLQLLN
ncbi:MoaF-related domain-containing protein [Rickettsiella endosymbiont of Xylota segnis]|uniref:MoaF-related domain-containing protein n=1 Tax=Rickettsiella endosymbiont of Xylota segnis TaxID=3066238 RepID=UPI0030CEDD10